MARCAMGDAQSAGREWLREGRVRWRGRGPYRGAERPPKPTAFGKSLLHCPHRELVPPPLAGVARADSPLHEWPHSISHIHTHKKMQSSLPPKPRSISAA